MSRKWPRKSTRRLPGLGLFLCSPHLAEDRRLCSGLVRVQASGLSSPRVSCFGQPIDRRRPLQSDFRESFSGPRRLVGLRASGALINGIKNRVKCRMRIHLMIYKVYLRCFLVDDRIVGKLMTDHQYWKRKEAVRLA